MARNRKVSSGVRTPQPLGSQVLIKRDSPDDVTKGGIVLAGSGMEDNSTMGTVLAVGPGTLLSNGEFSPVRLSVGDRVVFGPHAGAAFKVADDAGEDWTFTIMQEREIYCRL